MARINPYVTFNGNCEEAFNFYKECFGIAEFADFNRFSEMPSEEPMPDAVANKVMHATLKISKETVLMGSDANPAFGVAEVSGNNIAISINTDSKEETDKIYNALSADGKVTMPLAETFWGAYFGMFTDKFGIQWMINCQLEEK
ncbi:VOC family protein [Aureivirga sp. CE67]|uniref:VOC family protein n=1 Tax=Aureivirga sp. CE67 TaxID=1788983 RepID=UPI0018CBC394|nr:VOC family protein [Aureivirga sp. CE67]